MDSEKIQDLLLQMLTKISYIEAKIDSLDEQKITSRIDNLEAQNSNHEHSIRALENRNNQLEQFVRNSMVDGKKSQTSITVSVGLAVVSALVSIFLNIF